MLAQAEGAGIVRRIWITIEKREKPQTLKGYRLECFWDGCEKPAVSVPLGDFFCFNSAKLSAFENEFFSAPEGRSFNCVIPMPFQKGMKITISNDTPSIEEIQFFYQVDYTLGDDVSDALYFHAFYNREKNTVCRRDYVVLPKVEGRGRYLGASFGVIANPLMGNSWWGEGEVKCYLDGDGEYLDAGRNRYGGLYRHRLGAGQVCQPLSGLPVCQRGRKAVLFLSPACTRSGLF